MKTTFFDSLSHADFLRLTLEAFARQGYTVEQSRIADADGVLVGKSGARIGLLCKKYRGAFIGRPVLQQFHGAMRQLRCKEGYLVTTTDCSPDAREFAAGKGIVLYNGERTTELLRTAFGDELIGKGRMPELGKTSGAVPPAARQTVSTASYEKVAATGPKRSPGPAKAPEPGRSPVMAQAPGPVISPEPPKPPEPARVQESRQALEPISAPEPASVPEPLQAPEAAPTPEPVQAQEPEKSAAPGQAPQEKTAIPEELPEEVQELEELLDEPAPQDEESPASPEAAPSGKTTIIVCLECNKRLQVPIDQGMITVHCPECGMRRVYQPELNEAGELKTTTVIGCPSCKQKLNVPTNRGQLNVRCPQCRAAWVFTP